jgi:NADH dehydrogenase
MTSVDPRPHVVIVGGGFGGLYAARALRGAPVRVTLLDRRNHHLFQPLLYQVATAALNPSDIAMPLRSIFRKQANVTVLLAEAARIDPTARKVILTDGEISYDRVIVATGATHSYFGRDSWAPHAPGLKSIEDALEIRRRVLLAYEAAEREPDPARRRAWLTFVIVGGGPTGVELAGALAEISRHALARDFRTFDPKQARIVLLEGAPRLLQAFPPELSEKAREQLARLDVEVMTGRVATGIDDGGVTVGTERIPARTVIWAAGVAASPLARSLGAPLDRAGRVLVAPDLAVPGHPEITVIGDLAAVPEVPGVAQGAIQMGRHAAANIRRAILGEPLLPFRYKDPGLVATIGRGAAVAAFPRSRWSGVFAWWLWLSIHIFYLIGFRNRLLVMIQWAWSFFTFQRGVRLITGDSRPKDGAP